MLSSQFKILWLASKEAGLGLSFIVPSALMVFAVLSAAISWQKFFTTMINSTGFMSNTSSLLSSGQQNTLTGREPKPKPKSSSTHSCTEAVTFRNIQVQDLICILGLNL